MHPGHMKSWLWIRIWWDPHLVGSGSGGIRICWDPDLLGSGSVGIRIWWDPDLVGSGSDGIRIWWDPDLVGSGSGRVRIWLDPDLVGSGSRGVRIWSTPDLVGSGCFDAKTLFLLFTYPLYVYVKLVQPFKFVARIHAQYISIYISSTCSTRSTFSEENLDL